MDKEPFLFAFGVAYLVGGIFLRRRTWVGLLMLVLGGLLTVFSGLVLARTYVHGRPTPSDPPTETTRLRLTNLQLALRSYRRDTGEYPTDAEGIRALWVSTGSYKWKGPYLEDRALGDGWGVPIVYRAEAPHGYVLQSAGKDRRYDTEDDIQLRP